MVLLEPSATDHSGVLWTGLTLMSLLAFCIFGVQRNEVLNRSTFSQQQSLSLALSELDKYNKRLQISGTAFSRLLSAFCDATVVTDKS